MNSPYLPPLADLRFVLNEVLGYERLFSLSEYRHADADVADAILSEAGRFAAEVLAPLGPIGDVHGTRFEHGRVTMPPAFRAAYAQYVEGGWPGLDMPREHGGQDLPLVLQAAFAELVNGACVAFGMLPLMERAATRLLIAHARPELVQRLVPSMAAGTCGATICISEPQAGSDVGRIATRARLDTGGVHRVSGTKMFITYGDHDLTGQIVHMVLARLPGAAPGTRGLSLFAVPSRRLDGEGAAPDNGVHIVHVERKMGLKASPTCVVEFDDSEGYLVGEEHAGLKAMFTMVNAMRLEVAVQGVAIAGAATARALRYATERTQGGAPDSAPPAIIGHADVRRMLYEMRARTEGLRALVLEAAFQLDLSRCGAPAERADALALAEWLLPVCKAYGSEAGFDVANLAVQVFGGHGYISDTGVEQYVRDSRVMSIYEGANGIQALDLVMRRLAPDGRSYRMFTERIRADLLRLSGHPDVEGIVRALDDGLTRLDACTEALLVSIPAAKRDAEAGASAYLKMVGLVGTGWMWLRMAAAAEGSPLQRTKRALAWFHAAYLMPEIAVLERRALLGASVLDELDARELAGTG